jgi:hypothetical protein
MTIKTAAGVSAGRLPRIVFSGAMAPDEPPITMMSRLFRSLIDVAL